MGKLGVLFDIERLGGGAYGMRAYQSLFSILDSSLLSGSTLSDGDVGNWYCIAIESFQLSKLHQIKSAVFRSNSGGLAPRQQRFIEGRNVETQPLVTAACVNSRGNLQGCETWFVQQAWDAAKKNRNAMVRGLPLL